MNKRIGTVPILLLVCSSFLSAEKMGNTSVVTEIYVPKVIIQAKWGTNAGEFGKFDYGLWTGPEYPKSLIVDSKGNIYILDKFNNRIQKFDNEGKYKLSIPVKSWCGNVDNNNMLADYIGVNLAVDEDDNIYYYLQKKTITTNEQGQWINNPNAKGEIWKFVKDKLVRKWEVRLDREKLGKDKKIEVKDEQGRVIGSIVSDFQGGTRFEPEKDYEVEKQKLGKDTEKVIIKFRDGRKIEKEVKAHRALKDTDILSVSAPKVLKKRDEIIVSFPRVFNKEKYKWEGQQYSFVYDLNGNLKSILKGTPSIHNDGNKYRIQSDQYGLKISKTERRPIRK